MFKRLLLIFSLVLILTLTFTAYAFAADFSDVQGHWAEKEINEWADKGLIGGYEDGTFKPGEEVTRAEFAVFINRAFDVKGSEEGSFEDVNKDDWYYSAVIKAKNAGYISGYEGNVFKPQKSINREEAACILAELLNIKQSSGELAKYKDAGKISNWAQGSVADVINQGLMSGYPNNTFKPQKSITRAEAVVTLDRALEHSPGGEEKETEVESAVKGEVSFNGSAVEDVTVKVFKAGDYKVLKEEKTGEDGKYEIKLDPGEYDITYVTGDKAGYESVQIKENKITTTDIALQEAAVINGTLADKNGNTIKETEVLFTTNPTFATTTNGEGEFTVTLLPGRTYAVRTYDPEQEDKKPEVVEEDLEVSSGTRQEIGEIQASFAVESAAGDSSGFSGDSGVVEEDTTPPKLTGASLTIGGEEVYAEIGSDGLSGEIDLTDEEGEISGGTLKASEDSTIKLNLTSIPDDLPDEYKDIAQDYASIQKTLEAGETETFQLSEDMRFSKSLLSAFIGSQFTLQGTLEDENGNVSEVTLTASL